MIGVRVLAEFFIRGKEFCSLNIDDKWYVTDGNIIRPFDNKDRSYMTLITGHGRVLAVQRCLGVMRKRNEQYVYYKVPETVIKAMEDRIRMLSMA